MRRICSVNSDKSLARPQTLNYPYLLKLILILRFLLWIVWHFFILWWLYQVHWAAGAVIRTLQEQLYLDSLPTALAKTTSSDTTADLDYHEMLQLCSSFLKFLLFPVHLSFFFIQPRQNEAQANDSTLVLG